MTTGLTNAWNMKLLNIQIQFYNITPPKSTYIHVLTSTAKISMEGRNDGKSHRNSKTSYIGRRYTVKNNIKRYWMHTEGLLWRYFSELNPLGITHRVCNSQGFIQRGGGGGGEGGPGIPPPPQDFEIQYDVIIIIMYTMDIVQWINKLTVLMDTVVCKLKLKCN